MADSNPDHHTNDYNRGTLVGNWYEDRLVDSAANTTMRVHGRDVAPEARMPVDLRTTKQAADQSVRTATPPAKVKKPSMFGPDNLNDRLATYGQPAATAYTLGDTQPRAATLVPERHLGTTNQHFYGELPAVARATCSDPSQFTPDKTHHKRETLGRDALDATKGEAGPAGKGARGEITRRPGESGNVYGVSVFVDEYSKWGTACAGRTLGDTVDCKMTKHF